MASCLKHVLLYEIRLQGASEWRSKNFNSVPTFREMGGGVRRVVVLVRESVSKKSFLSRTNRCLILKRHLCSRSE